MQKVERQKHRDRRRKRLTGVLLCAVLLAVCVTAGLLLRREAMPEGPEPKEDHGGTLLQRNEEELVSLTVAQKGQDPWTLVTAGEGQLRLQPEDASEPSSWIVDENIGRLLINVATNLTYEDVFTENRNEWEPEAAAFGLAEPAVTAVFRFTDGTSLTARIGNSADPEADAYYYMTVDGDDRLFAVGAGTVEDLNTDKAMLHPTKQPTIIASLLDRITVRNGDGSVRMEWKLEGKVSDQDAAENWLITAPLTYPADYDAMKNLRDSAENLRLGVYVGNADEETLKQYGLDKPAAVLEVHMAAGSTGTVSEGGVYDVVDREELTETLVIGSGKSDMVDYALYGDEIYTVSHFSVKVFTEAETLSVIARYTVVTPLNSLGSVLVEKENGETVRYALVRKETKTTENRQTEEPGYTCLRNDEEISYDAFSAAWERLLTVTVSGRLPRGFKPGKAHTKYTFRTVSGGTHILELSD